MQQAFEASSFFSSRKSRRRHVFVYISRHNHASHLLDCLFRVAALSIQVNQIMHSFDLPSRSHISQSVDFAVVSHSHWVRQRSFSRNTTCAIIPLFSVCTYKDREASAGIFCRNLSFSLLVECIIFVRRGIQSSQIFLVNLWSHERNEMCCSSRNFVGYF